MSFIQCPECKKECQDILEVCPNCGFPLKSLQNIVVDTTKNSMFLKLLAFLMLILGSDYVVWGFCSGLFDLLDCLFDLEIFRVNTLLNFLYVIETALFSIGFLSTAIILLFNRRKEYLKVTPYLICGGYGLLAFSRLIIMFAWFSAHYFFTFLIFAALFTLYLTVIFKMNGQGQNKTLKIVLTCAISVLGFLEFVETIDVYGHFTNFSLFFSAMDYIVLVLTLWVQPYGNINTKKTTKQLSHEVMHMENGNSNYAPQQGNTDATAIDGYVKIWHLILFSILTLGIYPCVWVYRTVGLFNRKRIGEEKSQGTQVTLYIFVPFYSIYWLYKCSKQTEEYTRKIGNASNDLSVLSLILAIFGLGLVAMALIQDQINKNIQAEYKYKVQCQSSPVFKPEAQESKAESMPQRVENRISDADIEYLKKVKDLYDMGILAEDEYNTERKKILKS